MTFSGTHTIQTLYLVLNSTDLGNFDGWRWPFSGYKNGGSKVDLGYGRAGQKDIGGNFAYIYGLGNTESENFRPLNAFKILKSEFGSPTERNQWKLGTGDGEWKGHIAEVIAYSKSPTTSESEKIEGYLAHKWGLTEALPNSHPYKEICTVDSPKALASYSADISALVPGNTYYYRISASNSEGTHWSDTTTSFVSQSSLDVNSGQLFFDTNGPTPRWYTADGQGGNGVLQTKSWTDSQSNTVDYKVAKFSFSSVNIGDGVKVKLFGNNPIHIDATGDITINSPLDANGTSGDNILLTKYTTGKLGGGEGGTSWSSPTYTDLDPKHGKGPAHIDGTSPYNSGGSRYESRDLTGTGLIAGQGAGGGSYAGSGGRKEPNGGSGQLADHAISGQTYGTIDIDALLAGSGGGGGKLANGGSGGGGIKITAGGTLTLNSEIRAVGGRGGKVGDISDFIPG